MLKKLFNKEKVNNKVEQVEEKFEINLDKGLYLGSGIPLVGSEEDRSKISPVYIPWGELSGHCSFYGTTRVGKTRLLAHIAKQCINKGMDIVIIEPKGAVADKVDAFGKEVGAGQETIAWMLQAAEEAKRLNDFKYVSPKFAEISSTYAFNPLFGMTNEEIASLIANIIPSKEEFFATMGYQITMCVAMGLEFLEKVKGERYREEVINKEYERVYGGKHEEKEDVPSDVAEMTKDPTAVNRPFVKKDPPSRALITFADIASYASQEGVTELLNCVKETSPIIYQNLSPKEQREINRAKEETIVALQDMASKDKQYYSKVSSSFNLIMQQLSTGNLGRILCSSKINPIMDGLFNEERGQVILVQPFPLIFKNAATAFSRIFFAILSSFYGNIGASGRKAPRELALFIDEGGSVLYKGVENLFNKAGGLGLRIFTFTQSLADYEAELGPELAKIINDNTNIKVYMRMNDVDSRQTVSDSFGKIQVNFSKYMGTKLDMRIASEVEEREVLLGAHMADMEKQEFLLQYGKGRFYCCAPNQPDPDFLFKSPEIASEKTTRENTRKYRAKIVY